jgi:hypothetical protein
VLNTRHLEKILRAQCKMILQKDREEFEVRLSKKMVKQLEEAIGV